LVSAAAAWFVFFSGGACAVDESWAQILVALIGAINTSNAIILRVGNFLLLLHSAFSF
jgi:hypothetical protein